MDQFDDIIKEFLVESHENLDQLDRDLVALEESPEDRGRLASIFRAIHTIKGTSGFLGFPQLERVAHVGENLLVPLRDGEIRLTNDIANNLLGMVDAIRAVLQDIESSGAEGTHEFDTLLATLEALKEQRPIEPPPALRAPPSEPVEKAGVTRLTPVKKPAGVSAPASVPSSEQPAAATPTAAPVAPTTHSPAVASPATLDTHLVSASVTSTSPARAAKPVTPASPATQSTKTHEPPPPAAPASPAIDPETGEKQSSVADTTVRIDVSLLDRLMNLVGELVLARNQILQFSRSLEEPTFVAASQRLNLITTELQEGVMKTRMQPIRNVWSKLPRVTRDLASQLGKNVQLRMDGADTELDKTILEAIKDPLTHIVRNAIDHGIESPEARLAAGKPAEGTLLLRAFHEGGHVNIEILDDGRGIDLNRVKDKAISKGMLTADQASGMSERELMNLILLPGFSTAAQVTNVSGRGVGMDVVKTNVERIGGTLDIQSVFGKGTTLRIKIPLTLAIVPALVVTSSGDRYAIPQVSLLELVRLDGDRARREIEYIHNAPVYRLRGNLLPIVYLDQELGMREGRTDSEPRRDEVVNIVVLQAENRQFGLVVDHINDTQEIVVKPLSKYLMGIPAFAGSTIMGDGTVALILDVMGIAQKADVLTRGRDRSIGEASSLNADARDSRSSWLIVDPGDGSRTGISLEEVARLEEIDTGTIEQIGHREVVQYRGEILPLVRVAHDLAEYAESKMRPVVVFKNGNRHVGLVVGRIVDIVENDAMSGRTDEFDPSEPRIIQGRVTTMLDVASIIRGA